MDEQVSGWILDKKLMPDQQLSQGDLIRFADEQDPLRQTGLVVTADCDLEQKKHGRLITLVPVVTVQAILENYLLIEACEKQRTQIFTFACKSFGVDVGQEENYCLADLRTKLNELDESEGESARKLAADFVLHRLDVLKAAKYIELMKSIGSTPKGASSIEDQLRKKGDILILPSPSKFGVSGDMAWVRHIWQVPLGNIAIKTSDVKFLPGERIARLDSPFRYRLTQLMAQVFSDIGLPGVGREFKTDIEAVLIV